MIHMSALFLSPALVLQSWGKVDTDVSLHFSAVQPTTQYWQPQTHDPPVFTQVSWTLVQYNSGNASLELVAGHGAGIMNHSIFVSRDSS